MNTTYNRRGDGETQIGRVVAGYSVDRSVFEDVYPKAHSRYKDEDLHLQTRKNGQGQLVMGSESAEVKTSGPILTLLMRLMCSGAPTYLTAWAL